MSSAPSEPLQRPLPWLRGVYHLARRELLSLFVTPLAYLVGTLFLLNQGWNFALLLRVLNDPLAAPGPVMQFYFGGSFFILGTTMTGMLRLSLREGFSGESCEMSAL